MTAGFHTKNTHLSEVIYIIHVLRIELVDPKMHGARNRSWKEERIGLHSPRDKAK